MYLTNRPLMMLIDLHSVIDAHTLKLINSVGLLNEAKSLHAQLQPAANALDRLQSDNTTIADACEEWLSLLRADALNPHLTTVMKRFKEVIADLCAFTAGSDPFPASLLSSTCVD